MKATLFNLRFDCPECDQTIEAERELAGTTGKCPHCGTKIILPGGYPLKTGGGEKKILPAFLLCLFFGVLGVHAFYAGRTWRGRMYLLFPVALLVMLGIGGFSVAEPPVGFTGSIFYLAASAMWISGISVAVMVVVDFIAIISGRFRDGDGNAISEWT